MATARLIICVDFLTRARPPQVWIDSSAQLASAARAAALGIFPIGDLVDVDCELIGLAGANEDTE